MSTPTRSTTDAPSDARPPLWRRPAVLVLAGLALLLAIVVLTVFQPQRLLFDVTVDDDFPATEPVAMDEAAPAQEQEPAPDEGGDPPATQDDAAPEEPATSADEEPVEAEPEPAGPVILSEGTFSSRNRYTTEGTATVYELPDGSRTLRLEDFETTNGPDLFVYLTVADADASDPELDADVINLGDLRGNVGNQNYEIGDEVDLSRYDTVVIWCRRFSTSFGVADLA